MSRNNSSRDTATEQTPLVGTQPAPDTSKQAYLVLTGCCLLQFPVWGFVMSYGVIQEYYYSVGDRFGGDVSETGIIGNLSNGIMYLSMPALFGVFTHRLARYRKHAAFLGIILSALSLIASAYATSVWQLIVTQGVLQAIGATMLYSSTTMYLDEWFVRRKGLAYGFILGIKSFVGVGLPVIFERFLATAGFEWTLWIWAIITVILTIPALFLLRARFEPRVDEDGPRQLSWSFLKYRTFWFFQVANIIFSSAYGLPQTYLASFASSILKLSSADSALMLIALNLPSTFASFYFGLLSDGGGLPRRWSLSIGWVSLLSALGAALPTWFLWGFVPGPGAPGIVLLTLFAVLYGFFAGGYSATWGGVVKELASEARIRNEKCDTGLLFGLLNGGRGIGFVVGGLTGVQLLKDGSIGGKHAKWAYATNFGALIMFVGIASAFGGLSVFCKKVKAPPKGRRGGRPQLLYTRSY